MSIKLTTRKHKNDVVGHIRPICDGACSSYVIPMLNHIMGGEGGHAPSDHFSKLLYVSFVIYNPSVKQQ